MVIPLANYYEEISQPTNNGRDVVGVHYPGLDDSINYSVSAGQGLWLCLYGQDMVSCLSNEKMRIAAISLQSGHNAISSIINSSELSAVSSDLNTPQDYDNRQILARVQAMGLSYADVQFYEFNQVLTEPVIWRSNEPIVLIIILPETAEQLVKGNSLLASIDINVRQQPSALSNPPRLPAPLGRMIDEFTIQRGTAQSYTIPKGAYVQIIDVEGRQCSDFIAFNAHALDTGIEKHIDSTVSRTFTRGAYPRPGLFNKFYDSDIVPLLELVQDTIGRHDSFALACTARGYEERGFPGHVNCSDNISNAVKAYNVRARRAWPAINFFFNSWILPEHNVLNSDEAWSRPGDYVLMKALTDLVCVSTACPDDIDPINGWNPTDIHVRLYQPNNTIRPAIAYRTLPNEPANMTTESPFHRKTSQLTKQYEAHLDYWVPQYYETHGAIEEYWTCREKVVMQDMSNLRIIDICGNDALALLQKTLTRDITRIAHNKGKYALICDESGSVLDDGTLFNIGPNLYRWTCSSSESLLHLKQIAQKNNWHVWIRDMSKTLCTLAVQGPQSGQLLQDMLFIQPTQPSFENISWFGGCVARLHHRTGVPMYVSRTGYTGELGYELFCDNRDADKLWDSISAGTNSVKPIPMGAQALGLLRVEAGLMSLGNEFGSMQDPYECGLGFAVDEKKENYIGATALQRNRQSARRQLVGLILDSNETAQHGDKLYCGRHQIGQVTSAIYSPMLQKSIAMATVNVENNQEGNQVEIGKLDGHAKRLIATLTSIPFVDPHRKRPRGHYEC